MEILNVGIGEILLIFIIALLVFGPERLPEVARQAGRLWAQVRGAADEVQRTFMEESGPLREPLDEVRREVRALGKPIEEAKQDIAGVAQPLRDARDDLRGAVSRGHTPVAARSEAPPTAPSESPAPVAESPSHPYKPVSRSEERDGNP